MPHPAIPRIKGIAHSLRRRNGSCIALDLDGFLLFTRILGSSFYLGRLTMDVLRHGLVVR